MPDHRKPLPPPEEAESDEFAVEMMRGWIAKGGLRCALNLGHWHKHSDIDERRAWGVLLADLSRQLAISLEEVTGAEPAESLKVIVEAFLAELSREDDDAKEPASKNAGSSRDHEDPEDQNDTDQSRTESTE